MPFNAEQSMETLSFWNKNSVDSYPSNHCHKSYFIRLHHKRHHELAIRDQQTVAYLLRQTPKLTGTPPFPKQPDKSPLRTPIQMSILYVFGYGEFQHSRRMSSKLPASASSSVPFASREPFVLKELEKCVE